MTAPARHPIDYRTRQHLIQQHERLMFTMGAASQQWASNRAEIERLKWQINSGAKLHPDLIRGMGELLRHETDVAMSDLIKFYKLMCHAYPNGKVIWARESAPNEEENEKQPVTVGLNDEQRTGQEAHCGASPQANGSPRG